MKTILASAYAINPFKGSEDGMGWNFVYQIARYHKVIAVTRENNREAIEKFMDQNPDELYANIEFVYFDLPYWMRFWKKGSRGAMLYYLLWQRALPSFIKNKNLSFDIVHNLNFHNDWTPSYLWKLNKPFVWGPVGHHPLIPKQYLGLYKKAYFIKDRLTWLIKNLFWKLSPSLRKTVKKADHILCMNNSVAGKLKLKKDKYTVIPSVATQDIGFSINFVPDKFTLITAGRLVPLKGFDLSILAFAQFVSKFNEEEKSKFRLIVVGSGPELSFYKHLAIENKVEKQVQFIEWIERNDLLNLFKSSQAFIFPSHEGAGMVVAEALSVGLPVICLKNCGPGEFINEQCGFAVPETKYDDTVSQLAKAIENLFENKQNLLRLSIGAREHFESTFDWNVRGQQLNNIYKNL
jgi:glycosyltransferase involved in cell wall biosynthesis